MRAKGKGIIGMKIIGNGEFVTPEDREKSIRFAMSRPELDAVVIGFKSRAEIDEAIQRINRALAKRKPAYSCRSASMGSSARPLWPGRARR